MTVAYPKGTIVYVYKGIFNYKINNCAKMFNQHLRILIQNYGMLE